MVVYILKILPSTTIQNRTPTDILFRRTPTYDRLCIFGCLCYPNLSSIAPHKLALSSEPCVFLGFPSNHRGYFCYELSSNKITISPHVTFVEEHFPFKNMQQFRDIDYTFMKSDICPFFIPHLTQTFSNTQLISSTSPTTLNNPTPSTPTSPFENSSPPSFPLIPIAPPAPSPASHIPSRPPLQPSHPMVTRAKCGI